MLVYEQKKCYLLSYCINYSLPAGRQKNKLIKGIFLVDELAFFRWLKAPNQPPRVYNVVYRESQFPKLFTLSNPSPPLQLLTTRYSGTHAPQHMMYPINTTSTFPHRQLPSSLFCSPLGLFLRLSFPKAAMRILPKLLQNAKGPKAAKQCGTLVPSLLSTTTSIYWELGAAGPCQVAAGSKGNKSCFSAQSTIVLLPRHHFD